MRRGGIGPCVITVVAYQARCGGAGYCTPATKRSTKPQVKEINDESCRQGFYAECVVQAIAASAGLAVSREELEPEEVDFLLKHKRETGQPRYGRIEVQVKSDSNPRIANGEIRYRMSAKSYRALNGVVGPQLDMPRYLILVLVPPHFSSYCDLTGGHIAFSRLAYWQDLMGWPDLPPDQDSITVSVPERNLLTPEALVALTCGNREEAASWMSA